MEAPDMRAADADRDAVMAQLGQAYAEGRLDPGEYERRLEIAAHAVTFGDLLPLTADLPTRSGRQGPPAETAGPARLERRELVEKWRTWAVTAVILTSVWAVSSVVQHAFLFYWPLVPLGIWAAFLLARTINPDDDGDER